MADGSELNTNTPDLAAGKQIVPLSKFIDVRQHFVRKLRAADLFCGAGGTTEGAESSGAVDVKFALNHWQTAVDTHSANFPNAKHVNSRIEQTSPSECESIDLLFASPECTHHSIARGGKPTSDQQRAGAWHVLPWVEHHRPTWIVIENVVEFRKWGPIGKSGKPLEKFKGKFFDAWIQAIGAAGYRLDDQVLNAADFGAGTSRPRLFIIGRKGNRFPTFPEPLFTKSAGNALPGMSLPRWRSASECIDWSIPCCSIMRRKRQLADNTLLRIEAGLRRFIGPFVAQWDQTGSGGHIRGLDKPLFTMTTKANMGLTVPFLADVNHEGPADRSYSLSDSLGTITAKNGKAFVIPWLIHYYGTDNQSPVSDPLDTITTKHRHALCEAICSGPNEWPPVDTDAMRKLQSTMLDLGVCDIGFRMLQNCELSAAQGFRPEYVFHGSKADITRQIGNSVSPPVAKAICLGLAG